MSHQRTVYVVDGTLETRRSLSAQLAERGSEAWPFGDGAEFLEIVNHLMPACILLDMDLVAPSGLEVMAELARRGVDWPVIALSARDDVSTAVEAMKLGALDFLRKPVDRAKLSAALLPAWRALETSIETSEARRMAQERVARLTAREVDISLALLAGRPNKAVAHEFGISVRTVEMHRAHIMAKLGVKSLAEAAVLATHAGLALTPSITSQPQGESRLMLGRSAAPRALPAPYLARRVAARSAY